MEETRWWKYVTQLIGNDSFKDAAEKARFDKSAFSRWKKGAKADPEFAVKLARAYGANVLEALVESGLISEDEAKLRQVRVGGVLLTEANDHQLTDEVLHRLVHGSDAKGNVQSKVYDLDDRGKDDLIDRINAGLEPVAAQEATEPLEEHQP
ncbi:MULTISPECIES: helix-turn-helix transcriptional regulator [Corynebacterium]|uniref:helix-turn-helix transcriptional regulator n=1 Tax=Corynebacterium TaxID=1716 RepID=UPI0008A591E6|nr:MULTISPECIES: helix-turn-helix transcriptional regulator [Corynebacterium]MBE7338093.1 hypothetical protein [Corynebacterium aurimucosum]MCZ9299296.1 helix-turn-helix transcriptional regulator [Corynebacterium hesseae]OFK62639.1 hypothetical protein HMPREF2808_10940 [Corynebacterium sp. HMSC078A10]